jgi:hypothetical protein
MADYRQPGGFNNQNYRGGYSPYSGMPNPNMMRPNAPVNANQKNKKKKALTPKQVEARKQYQITMGARQQRALENIEYRRKVDALNKRGGIDRTVYRLAEDIQPKKRKDYFFIMRKGVCFFMFLILLVSVAFFALSYLKISAVPEEYITLFNEPIDETTSINYLVTDPIFGFIKNISGQIMDNEINLGDSTLYDDMLSKSETGMSDTVAGIVLAYYPLALIIYAITALFMMFKAFFGMFGKRIYKKFGLGSFIMILGAVMTALAGLAYETESNMQMAYPDVVNIIIGKFTGVTTFMGGYGLVALFGLPILVLFFSMIAKKKVPYSIFDN